MGVDGRLICPTQGTVGERELTRT